MSVKSWIVTAMIVAILGLGVEITTPSFAEEVSQLSQQQELAEAERLNQQVVQLYRQGKYAEAISLAEQALAIQKKVLGDNHPDVATTLDDLGSLYTSQGKYTEAELSYKQALTIRKQQLGDNHTDVAITLHNLGSLYTSQGKYTEAELFYKQALVIWKQQLGDNHPDIATGLNGLAALYRLQGRYTEAESLYKQALTTRKQELGENHPKVAVILNNLAVLYRLQGKYTEAELFYKQALAIWKQQLGDSHPDIALMLNNLAEFYQSQRKYTEAEPIYQEALAIIKQQLGNNHPDVALMLNNLAALYESQGRYTEAESFYQQALAIIKQQLGDNHPAVATILNNLAELYQSQGSTTRTIEFFSQGLKLEEYNLSENLIAGDERQKQDYMRTISGTTDGVISLNLQSAPNNPEATRLALTTIFERKGRILDVLTNSLQILRQRIDDPTTQNLLTQLITLRTQYSNLVFRKPEDIKSPDIYRQQLIELETKIKQLEDQLNRRSATFRNLSEPITLETIQQLIPKNSVLVELVRYQPFNPQGERWGEPRYAAYILRSLGQPQAVDLGEAVPIDRAVEQFRQNLCTKTKTPEATQFCLENLAIAQVKSSAQKLEQMVMQPVRQLLGDTTNILLSPDGKLNLVPFEALVDENERYLVENYNFTYLTSGRDLIRLQQKSASEEQPLVIADPLYNLEDNLVASNLPQRSIEEISELFSRNSFPRLAATEKEAKEIQSLLNLPTERVKLQSQASETLLKQVQSPHGSDAKKWHRSNPVETRY